MQGKIEQQQALSFWNYSQDTWELQMMSKEKGYFGNMSKHSENVSTHFENMLTQLENVWTHLIDVWKFNHPKK